MSENKGLEGIRDGETPEEFEKRTGGGQQTNEKSGSGDDLAEVTVAGQKYTVNKEMAEAMRQYEADLAKKYDDNRDLQTARLMQEIEDLKKMQSQQSSQANTGNEKTYSYADKLFEDPDGTLQAFGQKIIEDVETKLTKKYEEDLKIQQQNQALQNFWSEWKRRHEDLKESQPLANYVLQKNWNAWQRKTQEEVIDLLADETRKEILGYVDKFKDNDNTQQNSRAVTEGPSNPSGKQGGKEKPDQKSKSPESLTDLIKARKEARRKAAGLKVG